SLFLVLKIDPFDNVYRALLDNENGWVRQIFQSLGSSDITAVTAKQAFEYRVLKNLDTRVLRGADGKTALVYTFLDRQTLVVAQSDEALYHIYQVYNTPRSR
ncbi:MAG: hypothetical protein NTY66_03630, partial [Candidatus Vogelbacteria bacterium]|nr:hypothetical protein [Candidatus Vogelbacteria bacterium]